MWMSPRVEILFPIGVSIPTQDERMSCHVVGMDMFYQKHLGEESRFKERGKTLVHPP